MPELEKQIKVVADLRKKAQEASEIVKAEREKWEQQWKPLLDALDTGREEQAKAEAKLRELTLQAYAETGNKAPAEGVGIRERTVLTYDGKVAFDWAKAHKMALKLDTSAFEKIVKADTPDFVKITTEATATISQNLEV